MAAKREKGQKRHRFLWRFVRWPVILLLKRKFHYTMETAPDIPRPYIVLSNHNTDWDPLLVGSAFKKQMYFVASEHIFRRGWLSKLLYWLMAPIARTKGSTDGAAAMQILRTIKRGNNVCIFPEGNRSWNGVTGPLHPTTAKIVKASKAALVTFKLTGGYLTSPRWCLANRRGRMHGRVENVYTAEQIAAMSEEELMSAIERDLYEDAFETQRSEMVPFKGHVIASRLETALYMCPQCGELCTMHSYDTRFYCDKCGMSVIYNPYGFFENGNNDVRFETVYEWDKWQEQALHDMDFGSGPIFSDEEQTLMEIDSDHTSKVVAEGTMSLYPDRLEIGEFSVALGDISQMALHGRETIVFSSRGVNYEIYSIKSRSGRKYMDVISILNERAAAAEKSAEQASEVTEEKSGE